MRESTLEKQQDILRVLKKEPNGVWIAEIARRLGMKFNTVKYYIYPQTKAGSQFGGFLESDIIEVAREGPNKKIALRSTTAGKKAMEKEKPKSIEKAEEIAPGSTKEFVQPMKKDNAAVTEEERKKIIEKYGVVE